eukprot:SAG31_NODE_40056_length_283_cov_1.130435_2_plen_58_part_01
MRNKKVKGKHAQQTIDVTIDVLVWAKHSFLSLLHVLHQKGARVALASGDQKPGVIHLA